VAPASERRGALAARVGGRSRAFVNVLVGIDGRPGGRDAIALAQLLVAQEGHVALARQRRARELARRALLEAARSAIDRCQYEVKR
jgi:hypothetical protein